MSKNRAGKFTINRRAIESEFDKVRDFFNHYQIVVVRAEVEFCSDSIEYMGIADIFDEVAQNEKVPYYEIIDYRFEK